LSDKPKPPFYELEFSSDAPFWTGADASTRRTFLMPVSTPSEFLAFGVVGPSSQVLFVARGRVREHLGDFIARMVRDEAGVELYIRPPLPGWIIREYTSGPPHEGHEYDEPPRPPIEGLAPVSGNIGDYEASSSAPSWPEGGASSRRTLLVPLRDPAEFLALGVLGSADTVFFALRGWVKSELGDFIAQAAREGASVELYARPPLPESVVRKYLSTEEGAGNAGSQQGR